MLVQEALLEPAHFLLSSSIPNKHVNKYYEALVEEPKSPPGAMILSVAYTEMEQNIAAEG